MKTPKFNDRPCADAVKWLKRQPDAKTAWATCRHGDWMWWVLQNLDGALPKKSISVAYARWCANRAAKYAADMPANAANYARWAANAANCAAATANCPAATANCAAVAAAATANAAYWTAYWAAVYAVYTANVANVGIVDAEATERLAQADWIRRHFPCPIK